MLKINAIKINVNTSKGLYGFDALFNKGLNIVRGDNSSGKSTIFQSILYGLGMEELIGSRNDKAMQSVLKTEVLNAERIKEADVLESSIILEIQNESTITIERYIRSETKDSRLVNVYYGALLTGENPQLESSQMYVHDAGAATDVEFGFFAFLEEFLGLKLPNVQYNDGSLRKLYLQTIFPSFVIEQKVGWSDFLATIPYYNLRDKEKRAIEFILQLDSWRIEERKQEIAQEKQIVESKWNDVYTQIKDIARRSAAKINGIEEKPSIINDPARLFLTYLTPEKNYNLDDYIAEMTTELVELETKEIPKINEIAQEKENELNSLNDNYNQLLVSYNDYNNKRNNVQSNIQTIRERLKQIEEELTHNKHHLKVKRLASESDITIAKDTCPTCHQSINDSLLPANSVQIPMNIEQNIEYLEAQKGMVKLYLENHRKELQDLNGWLQYIQDKTTLVRDRIRAIKRDLVSDDRLPSVEIIEHRIKLKNRLEFYKSVSDQFDIKVQELLSISTEWQKVLSQQENLPRESFSRLDFTKLKYLNEEFIALLEKFDYGSKSLSDLSIPKDKLIPVAEGQYSIKYNMRLDSSASDLVRAITAYTCSLYKVSEKYPTNHPGIIMFDEPGTQETAISSLREMLKELQSYKAQSIVFASFKQSDTDFNETTSGLSFNLIKAYGKKFIVKKES